MQRKNSERTRIYEIENRLTFPDEILLRRINTQCYELRTTDVLLSHYATDLGGVLE